MSKKQVLLTLDDNEELLIDKYIKDNSIKLAPLVRSLLINEIKEDSVRVFFPKKLKRAINEMKIANGFESISDWIQDEFMLIVKDNLEDYGYDKNGNKVGHEEFSEYE